MQTDKIMSVLVVASMFVGGQAIAVDMPAVAKKNNCTACHAIDKKVVGPSWVDVAKKYKGDAKALALLETKIKKGGAGVWGAMPMPASPKLSDADATELAKFVLAL